MDVCIFSYHINTKHGKLLAMHIPFMGIYDLNKVGCIRLWIQQHVTTVTFTRALSHSSSPYAVGSQSRSKIMTKVFVYRIYNRCRSKERTIKDWKTCQCATGQNLQLQWILHTGNTRSASKNLVRPDPWAQCQACAVWDKWFQFSNATQRIGSHIPSPTGPNWFWSAIVSAFSNATS